jgi:hypothetical protein
LDRLPSESARPGDEAALEFTGRVGEPDAPGDHLVDEPLQFLIHARLPVRLFEFEVRQEAERLNVLLARLLDHVVGKARHRGLLVPSNFFEIIANELFVEARLRAAGNVKVPRPEAR